MKVGPLHGRTGGGMVLARGSVASVELRDRAPIGVRPGSNAKLDGEDDIVLRDDDMLAKVREEE